MLSKRFDLTIRNHLGSVLVSLRKAVSLLILGVPFLASCLPTGAPGPGSPPVTDTLRPSPPITSPAETQSVGLHLVQLRLSPFSGGQVNARGSATITLVADPVIVSPLIGKNGESLGTSSQPWQSNDILEMDVCMSWDDPCSPSGTWTPFVQRQEFTFAVDWLGERTFWVGARFRDAAGDAVPASGDGGEPQPQAQVSTQVEGIWDIATPLEALPPPVQTGIAATQSAYPVVGSVSWEGGRCCAGGVAGQTIQVRADFTAESPGGNVREMRVRIGGLCFSEDELAAAAWEPFTPSKSYPHTLVTNWVGLYISVQYRDEAGNLSPAYCDDISIEGMPPLTP
jgi:hypothetical protein